MQHPFRAALSLPCNSCSPIPVLLTVGACFFTSFYAWKIIKSCQKTCDSVGQGLRDKGLRGSTLSARSKHTLSSFLGLALDSRHTSPYTLLTNRIAVDTHSLASPRYVLLAHCALVPGPRSHASALRRRRDQIESSAPTSKSTELLGGD